MIWIIRSEKFFAMPVTFIKKEVKYAFYEYLYMETGSEK